MGQKWERRVKRADSALARPLIVNTAFTGAVSDKSRNSAVPYSTEEIVADAIACAEAGMSMGHFHVRTEDGQATNDAERYRRLFAALRAEERTRQTVIVASTSGRHGQTLEERCAVLRLPEETRPDMASLTLSSLNFASGASINEPDTIRALAEEMQRRDVKPELEAFDLGMIAFAHRLIDEGLVTPPCYFNIILGNVAGAQADLATLAALIGQLPDGSIVSLGGIGRAQHAAHLIAVAEADAVRTGLEDNLRMPGGRQPATNADLVGVIRDIATLSGRALETPGGLRTRLALAKPW
jgi:3-keto-5-aminohexanoate cleavage enzyme